MFEPFLSKRRTTVTSAELTRQFGQLRQSASVEPVFITHHGRETHVLLTLNDYQWLTSGAANTDIGQHVSTPLAADVANWIDQACIVLDDEGEILFANLAAHAIMARQDGTLVGHNLYEAVPELGGSLIQSYVNRSIATRQHCAADLPSTFRDGAWIRLEVYPAARRATLLFKDITEDVKANRFADFKQTVIEAVDRLGEVGRCRLDVRGRIERADDWCARMLGLSQERLHGVAITDLAPRERRVALRETVDAVLSGDQSRSFDTEFIANNGDSIAVHGVISELRGAYGSEGAVIVLARGRPS